MTPDQIRDLQTAFAAFKQAHESGLAEIKRYGSMLGDTKARLDRIDGDLENLEAKIARRGGFAGDFEGRKSEAHRLFFDAIRGKAVDPARMESKGLISGDDTRGGYLAPPEYVGEVIANITEFSPIRSVAGICQTSRASVAMPKKTSSAAAVWVEEAGTRSETTNPAFGLAQLPVHEMYALAKVSKQEMEDAAFDLEAFLRAEFASQFGVTEGAAFVSGNGVGKPYGFATDSTVSSVKSGHASQITGDGLISLLYAVKETYANNGYFLLNRSTLKTIRQLKDGQGQYLWSPGIAIGGRPATILDRPYLTCVDMPDIGAGNYPVAFGDWRRGYLIVDRVALEVTVDPFSSKSTGMVEVSARRRVGGQVVLSEALATLQIAA